MPQSVVVCAMLALAALFLSGAGHSAGSGAATARLGVDWHARLAPPRFLEYAPRERSLPAVDPARGWLFVADRFGKVRSFDVTGRWRWEVDVGGAVEAGLVVDGDSLYVATTGGGIFSLDTNTGEENWSYIGTSELATTPTVASGRLLVPSLADTLLALEAQSGEFLWLHRRPRPEDLTIRGAAPAVVQGETVVTGFSDGGVVALRLDDGDLLWRAEVGRGEHPDINASPVVRGDVVYAASFGGSLHALEMSSGRELWRRDAAPGATRMMGAADSLIIASPGLLTGHALSDGRPIWRTGIDEGSPSEITGIGGWITVGSEEGPLYVLNAGSGRPLFAFDPGTGVSGGALPDAGGLWLFSNGGRLYRLSWPD